MFLGVLDYGLLFTTVVPIKMFDDLQTIQNHALRSVLNVYNPLDLHVNQLHHIVGVRFLKHRMFIQLMMCIRNAYINKSLPVIQRDLVNKEVSLLLGITNLEPPAIKHSCHRLLETIQKLYNKWHKKQYHKDYFSSLNRCVFHLSRHRLYSFHPDNITTNVSYLFNIVLC